MEEEKDVLQIAMREAIIDFKAGNQDNPLDKALGMLTELPPSRLSDTLLTDMNWFIRSVWNEHTLWKARQGKKK